MKFSYDSQQWISMQIFLIKLWIAFFLREKAVDTKLIFERGIDGWCIPNKKQTHFSKTSCYIFSYNLNFCQSKNYRKKFADIWSTIISIWNFLQLQCILVSGNLYVPHFIDKQNDLKHILNASSLKPFYDFQVHFWLRLTFINYLANLSFK